MSGAATWQTEKSGWMLATSSMLDGENADMGMQLLSICPRAKSHGWAPMRKRSVVMKPALRSIAAG
jgi:hypothetical protein